MAKNLMPSTDENWTGYTLEDLRYRRAYVGARCELEKERLLHNVSNMRGHAGQTTMRAVEKISSGIPLLNYGLVAYSVGSRAWKFARKFIGRRKAK